MLGRFHEISLPTSDIRASVEFYERLGFTQAQTGDTWPHPYGVVTDGRIVLGLHQTTTRPAALSFVRADVAELSVTLEQRGVPLAYRRTGNEVFNEIGLTDPAGQLLVVLEARTYSPAVQAAERTSACGYFMQYSVPGEDFAALKNFWEPFGFVAADEATLPYPHLPLISDHLDLAFHRRQFLGRPALVFLEENMAEHIARVRALGIGSSRELPVGLAAAANALLEAPEGTLLLLLTGAG
ncbi:MAG TPA: VOC family protein [Steroidobacteraceae bacterium]|nr:VOC family protein [Steroidobacteraceae bacterium]